MSKKQNNDVIFATNINRLLESLRSARYAAWHAGYATGHEPRYATWYGYARTIWHGRRIPINFFSAALL